MSGSNTLTINRTTPLHGINVLSGGTFNAGAGAISTTVMGGMGLENNGTFVGGAGAISTYSLRNGNTNASAALTVGSGGIATTNPTWGDFAPKAGTITLNGNLTVMKNIQTGTATFSGTGKMILTNAAHNISGPVNVHNLETATFSTGRTITLSGTVTATGTTKLNGSATGSITFLGGTFTPATTAYYCAGATTTGVTCNSSAPPPPPPTSAPIDLNMNKPVETFATEIELK